MTALFLVPSTTALSADDPVLTANDEPVDSVLATSGLLQVSDPSTMAFLVDEFASSSSNEGPVDPVLGAPEGLLRSAVASKDAQAAVLGTGVPVALPLVPEEPNRNIAALASLSGSAYCERTSSLNSCRGNAAKLFSPNEYQIHWCVGPCSGWGTTDGKVIIHLTTQTSDSGYYSAWCVQINGGVYSGQTCYPPTWGSARRISGEIFHNTASGWFSTGAYEY